MLGRDRQVIGEFRQVSDHVELTLLRGASTSEFNSLYGLHDIFWPVKQRNPVTTAPLSPTTKSCDVCIVRIEMEAQTKVHLEIFKVSFL